MAIRKLSFLIAAALCLFSCTGTGTPTPAHLESIELTACQISSPVGTTQVEARCGTLSVYEDSETQSGRKIDLHLAVIPAVSRSAAPDPLFFLAGGPGEAATQSFMLVASAFEDINRYRDIVLIDQRGTGQSGSLSCYNQEQLTEEINSDDVTGYLNACLTHLDADPTFYTTSEAVSDLDQVREALGYEKINLYGVSYGTRTALVYLREYPEHVRSLILDGVAPPNWSLGEDTSSNAQRALDLIFQRCQEDEGCKTAFTDLPDKFQTIIERLDAAPAEITLPNPTTGEVITTTMDVDSFTSTIFNMSYSPEMVSLIPLLIHTTYERQDYQMAAAQEATTITDLSSRLSDGMRYSVVCSEDLPFLDESSPGDGYIEDPFGAAFQTICETWPHITASEEFKQPVHSELPVLILSGEMDPVTPPANGDLAAETLPNSLHLVVAGQGHVNIYRGCIPFLASKFIDEASVQGLDPTCIEDIEPLPFFISFSGPQP